MTAAEELAAFVVKTAYEDISAEARLQLKIRVLDSLGCAIGALQGEPIKLLRVQIQDFGGADHCALIGGGRTAPDRAALYNSALVRYLDFNDSYLAPGETCHPSDNLGAMLAATEYAHKSGRDLLTALAVAYQVQCRLSDVAPVRTKGFDHTTQGSYAVAAGVAKVLGLDCDRTADALAVCGTAFNSLRVTRTGALSQWKGLAYPNTVFACIHATFLAMRGITGPREVFEGKKGFMDVIAGPFHIDWSRENLERVTHTVLKKYNAEVHSQAAIEGILELQAQHGFAAADVCQVEIEIFDVAYHIIGGGDEGSKTTVHTKEEADHSLPYLVAVAILDNQVLPQQYQPEHIQRPDVQDLLRRVVIRPSAAFSARFPQEMPCRLRVSLRDGQVFTAEKQGYEGFSTTPMRWETVVKKFMDLSSPYTESAVQREIVEAVLNLETISVAALMQLLARVQMPSD